MAFMKKTKALFWLTANSTNRNGQNGRPKKADDVRIGTDLILKQRAKAYVNGEIYLEYICMAFFRISTNCEVWRNLPMRMQFY
jgi:hypothetical protein